MNFLQLTQRLARECGVAGVVPAVAGQVGEYQRLVEWINQAWIEIQLERQWNFRHVDMPQTALVIGKQRYAAADFGITDLESWDIGTKSNIPIANLINGYSALNMPDSSIRIYRDSAADEIALPFVDYPTFRATYMTGAQNPSRPQCFSLDRNNALLFGATPEFAYTLNADYIKTATELVISTDTPIIQSDLHMMIVYKAMEFYGGYEEAADVLNRGAIGYARMMKRLNRIEKPRIEYATGVLA